MPERRCSMPGCSKAHRARGLCSTHYNAANAKLVGAKCAWCGIAVIKSSLRNTTRHRPTCSTQCRTNLQHGGPRCAVPIDHASRTPLSCPVPSWHPVRSSPVPITHPSRTPRRILTAGNCADCGDSFVVVNAMDTKSRYCSKRCMVRVSRRTRRAREHGATGAWTWDAFARLVMQLGNECAYCGADNDGQPFDPDHVVPLSRGGHNGLTNLLPACRACNCDKRDLLVHEWIVDRTRRGLPPVRYDVDRFMHLTAHRHAVAA